VINQLKKILISTSPNIYWYVRKHGSTNPAKMAARSEMNHSAELKPSMPTPWYISNPSYTHTSIMSTDTRHYLINTP